MVQLAFGGTKPFLNKFMKTYIVYDKTGNEIAMIKAGSHNSAEKKAIKKHGAGITVAYTEV
jgi:hypothetical protein